MPKDESARGAMPWLAVGTALFAAGTLFYRVGTMEGLAVAVLSIPLYLVIRGARPPRTWSSWQGSILTPGLLGAVIGLVPDGVDQFLDSQDCRSSWECLGYYVLLITLVPALTFAICGHVFSTAKMPRPWLTSLVACVLSALALSLHAGIVTDMPPLWSSLTVTVAAFLWSAAVVGSLLKPPILLALHALVMVLLAVTATLHGMLQNMHIRLT